MRGLKLFWGAIAAAALLSVLFLTLREAQAATQVRAAAQVQAAKLQPVEAQLGAVDAAAQWLVEQHQNEDGGYTSFSTGAEAALSDVGGTADAILGLAGTGYNVATPYPGRAQSPVDFLLNNADDVAAYAAQSGGANGKLVLALTAAAQDPRDFGGYDFTISLTQHLSPTGQFNVVSPYEQGLAMLALNAINEPAPAEAVEWLLSAQAQEGELAGSWDDGFGTMGNVDATAMAIMALVAVGDGTHEDAVSAARDFLMAQQLDSGGWGYAPGLPESANSTALAVQALSALGEDFYRADGEWAVDGVSPLAALLGWQSESGALQADFGEGPADDFFTTVQALPALTGRSYPLPARQEAARQAISCLATLQDTDSGGWEEFPGTAPNAGGTSRAIRAIVAHGGDPADEMWAPGEQGPVGALETMAPNYLQTGRGGRVGIVMRGATAAGEGVEDFGGLNLPVSMTTYLSPTGEYDSTAFGPFSHAQAMLGLLAAEQDVDPSAEEWLVSAQTEDGGWGSADATGISLQVLALLDDEAHEEAIAQALENLQATQQADGGWGFELPSSVNSTSEVAQGLTAVGENPFAPGWSVVMSGTLRNAVDVALSQQGDNGCWPNLFGEGDDPYATTDGIILLSLSPPWGAGFEGEVETEPEAPAEVAATAEADETPEVVVEETEVVPSPTAEEDVAQEAEAQETEAPTTEPPAEVEEPAATPTTVPPADAAEGAGGIPVWIWIVAAVVLLALAGIFFALSRRRA